MADGMTADVLSLRNLARQFRTMEPRIARRVNTNLRAAAEDVVAAAREKASWSTRIPPTIHASASGVTSVTIRAGTAKAAGGAPHAKAYEHAGAPGAFRHPVFGNRQVWVSQQGRPFLHPAVIERLEALTESLREAVILAIREV